MEESKVTPMAYNKKENPIQEHIEKENGKQFVGSHNLQDCES